MRLADLCWPDLTERSAASILAIPVGSTEQHGPHLPLSTDTDIALAVADRAAASRTDLLVAPPVAYGSSGEHAGFAGTLSVGQAAVEQTLIELVRSASAFRAIVIVSAHGGNASPVAAAVARLAPEGHDVLAWSPDLAGDLHAGRSETSMLLAIAPDLVRLDRAEAGDLRALPELIGALRSGGVASVSPNGVLGDPAGASADEGTHLLESLAASLVRAIDGRWPE